MINSLEKHPNRKPIISAETATEAGQIPVGSHENTLNPGNICAGGQLKPGKTRLSDSELSSICAKCSATFIFNPYSMEWIHQLEY